MQQKRKDSKNQKIKNQILNQIMVGQERQFFLGQSDFKSIIRDNTCYIDKTLFIKDIIISWWKIPNIIWLNKKRNLLMKKLMGNSI